MRVHPPSATLLAAALAATLAACGMPPSAPDLPSLERAAAASARRPLVGSCELSFSPAPPSQPAPPPGVIRQIDVGTCQLSHLGRTAYAGVLEIDFANGTQRGTRTLTAANGDQLFLTAVGTSAPSGPGMRSIAATLTITGGTGRFANARGELHATGTANLITSTTVSEFEGWIAY